MEIYERLKQLRKEYGYLQKDIAEYLNISKSAYGYYEQGRNEMDIGTLVKLSALYKISVDYLLCKTNMKDSSISQIEEDLIRMYRTLDDESKNIVYGAIYALYAKKRISLSD